MSRRKQDLTGQKFGMLTFIKEVGKQGTRITWLVQCECGTEKMTPTHLIKNGNTKSCGCLATKHSASKTKEYGVWTSMKGRCLNPNDQAYSSYGGRGITICDRWLNDFQAFLDDMGPKPAKFTVERIDNDGPYSPENCTWASREDQASNRRNTRNLTAWGETKTISRWSRDPRCKVSRSMLTARIDNGWNHEISIISPARPLGASLTRKK